MGISKLNELKNKSISTIKQEGFSAFIKKGKKYLKYRKNNNNQIYDKCFKDVLFINGCSLPHPQRYRVDHQIEQLTAAGLSCAKIDYDKVTVDLVRYFRAFVIYRCPIIPTVEEFVKLAKENNKVVFYDIDDLVFDLSHTKDIKYLNTLSKPELDLYNDGVKRMGETLKLCDYGIASTERLQHEMGKYLKEVFVNRNVASEEMVKYSQEALINVKKDDNKVVLGYLSGTITHNDDFKLIMPSIIKILKKYDNVYLQIVGLLDLPEEMQDVKHKVITSPFVDWKELPNLTRSIDINLAPLEDSIFNEAKSENKWTEAALVKIPTVASNVGAFKSQIEDGKTGFLCSNKNEWTKKLTDLIESKDLRDEIGNNAYDEVMNNHITIKTGAPLRDFILSKLHKNICFVVPSPNISGGIMVIIKHASVLKKRGYDVTLINGNIETEHVDKVYESENYIYVISTVKNEICARIDVLVATMWLTLDFVKNYPNCGKRKYLVQGYETEFYKHGEFERIKCESTYNDISNIDYLTVSKWCESWLINKYNKKAKYIPNGMYLSLFEYKKRNFDGKIKILIEGNCNDIFKNVDESFRIVDKLDKNKFEITYLSYEKEPKKWYHVDKFYHKVPHEEVGKIYQENDILIKTSILESFSYPPLEMMSTGGVCVALLNDGNKEYLKDMYNCLTYNRGNIDEAVKKIELICNDKKIRSQIIKNGLETAKGRDWNMIEEKIVNAYMDGNK